MADKVRKRLFDNVSKLNVPEEHQRVGRPISDASDPVGTLNSMCYQEPTPLAPGQFRAEVIDIVEEPSAVTALLMNYFNSDNTESTLPQKIYKIRCDLVSHLQNPNNFEEGSDERNFYMSVHPDASLDYSLFSNPDIEIGSEVICYYEDPSKRGSIRIDEVVPKGGNEGSTTNDMGDTGIKGSVKGFFEKLGQGVKSVLDTIAKDPEDINFKVPTNIAKLNGYAGWGDEDTLTLGRAVKTLLVPAATKMTSPFGNRTPPVEGASAKHGGIDIAVDGKPGHAIISPRDGTVQAVVSNYRAHPSAHKTWVKNGGNQVWITHDPEPDGKVYSSRMLHLQEIAPGLKPGDKVKRGQVVATLGNTGIGSGPHLHYTVREVTGGRNKKVNPINILTSVWSDGKKNWNA